MVAAPATINVKSVTTSAGPATTLHIIAITEGPRVAILPRFALLPKKWRRNRTGALVTCMTFSYESATLSPGAACQTTTVLRLTGPLPTLACVASSAPGRGKCCTPPQRRRWCLPDGLNNNLFPVTGLLSALHTPKNPI